MNDGEEWFTHNTDPLNEDTDGDGFIDGVEVDNGTNPLQKEPTKSPTEVSLILHCLVHERRLRAIHIVCYHALFFCEQ